MRPRAAPLAPVAEPCRRHAEILTETRCEACGGPFCGDCLVSIAGRRLCGPCKRAAVRDLRRRAGPPDREADEALAMALMGLVPCFSPLVWPFAMVRSAAVLAGYRRHPERAGAWKSRLAVWISVVTLAAWVIGGTAWLLTR